MTTLTASDVYALARSVGLDPASSVIATAVATSESGLRTDAIGDVALEDTTWGPSVGLWQIRSLKAQSGTGGTRDATRLTDPAFNAKSMAAISGTGSSFGAWSTYTSGAYRANVSTASTAASAVNGNKNWLTDLAHTLATPVGTAAAAIGSAGSAVGSAVSAMNPTSGWAGQATAIALKLAMVSAGLALLVIGATRLVAPAAQGAISTLGVSS
jgi:hypothetical protein